MKKIIALDAMGGDYAPRELVRGAIEAAIEQEVKILLVGKPEEIEKEKEAAFAEAYSSAVLRGELEIVPATEVIAMDEEPARALRRKKDASIAVATRLVKEGAAQAVVSAGSTGAQMAAAVLILGRIPGVERPAIATVIPGPRGPRVLLDSGANVDCRPLHLEQFARMGSVFAAQFLGQRSPRVGLLNIGEEEGKGNELTQQAYQLLKKAPLNFVGNIEGREVFTGEADVIVCDGFVGNVVLKLTEGLAKMLMDMLREELLGSFRTKAGAWLAMPGFKSLRQKMDYAEYGGAPLLGVKGISLICHGSSKARAIRSAVRAAAESIENRLVERLESSLVPPPGDHSKGEEVYE